ncbi:N-acetyltransferase family protein [Mesorhizobium sp. L-8-3]|uniref:N-acetyltransferase family protein n=1 Tax=Mesorhizobium sp. L-8-3 TaxID=2744522 RepID=UPI00406C2E76
MAGELIMRRAERRDAAELAILVDIASHGFASWFWYGAVLDGSLDTAMEKGRMRMRDDPAEGWQGAVVAEWKGDLAGALIAYQIGESLRDMPAPHPVVEPILALQRQVIGNRFVDSLGVYREHRGKGIGRALLAQELRESGEVPTSLITENHNETALSLYRSSGFLEVSRAAAVPLSADHKRHDWVLLTRNPA